MSESILEINGRLLDSPLLTKTMPALLAGCGDCKIVQLNVGLLPKEPSWATLKITTKDEAKLNSILCMLELMGARVVSPKKSDGF